MFKGTRAIFSFTEVTDPRRHKDYNIWHMLEHWPENLALPGIVHGGCWVSSPDCIKARQVSDPPLDKFHYMDMYWMQESTERTFRDFVDLEERTTQKGCRPEMPWARRCFAGVFFPVKCYVSPRIPVSPQALPFRPTQGLLVALADLIDPDSADARDMLQWYDDVHIPDMLQCKGMAGMWTFRSDPAYSFASSASPNPRGRMISFYYLDEDPLEVLADMAIQLPKWRDAGRLRDNARTKKQFFIGPLRTMIPWQWDWFDKEE